MWTMLLLMSFIILGLLNNGCGYTRIDINDHSLYYLKEASQDKWAVNMHFLTSEEHNITHAEWDTISEGMVAMSLADWADINTTVSHVCSSPGIDCSYKVSSGQTMKQALNNMFAHLQSISGHKFQAIR